LNENRKMKILVEYKNTEENTEVLKVKLANYLSDFALRITFNNGVEKLIDFKPFLSNAIHPSIKKYFNETLFKNFQIVDGNLNWNDYDLIFPISDLYNCKLEL
jgi:hypothetical protein